MHGVKREREENEEKAMRVLNIFGDEMVKVDKKAKFHQDLMDSNEINLQALYELNECRKGYLDAMAAVEEQKARYLTATAVVEEKQALHQKLLKEYGDTLQNKSI